MNLHRNAIPLGLLLLCCKTTSSPPSDSPASTGTGDAPVTSINTSNPSSLTAAPPAVPSATGDDSDRAFVARGEQAFAARLYSKLATGSDKNLFFSPTSIRMALAMTYAGAKGDTAGEMQKTLAFGSDAARVHKGFATEIRALSGANTAPLPPNAEDWQKSEWERKRQTVRVVNRLWGRHGHNFKPDFLSVLDQSYAAPLQQLDFQHAADKSRVTINDFIANQTEQRIKDLIPAGAIHDDTKLVLTNAVYFKANWDEPFRESSTTDGDFHAAGGKTVKAKLMDQTHDYPYATVAGAQLIELPYASGTMSMVIVLPSASNGLDALERGVGEQSIASWLSALSAARVHLTLPRFKLSSELRLEETLAQMGMPTAFDLHKADFSGMDGTRELFIGSVIHKAFVGVDEKGTEAAAATAVLMLAGAAPPTGRPVEFRVDHPFLFFLREKDSGCVLFMGRVVDPTG